jgi:hypothetical protein
MKDEIIAGLKNAIERGESFEKAVQSFINAGYDSAEVREAAEEINCGALQIISPAVSPVQSSTQIVQPSNILNSSITEVSKPSFLTEVKSALTFHHVAQTQSEDTKSDISKTKVIVLVSILVLLLLLLGTIFIFKQQIAGLFGG